MDRHEVDRKLDSLTRAELRKLSAALFKWVGADAASRLIPDGPFAPRPIPAQLQLATIDPAAASTRIEHLTGFVLSLVRLASSDEGQLADALDTEALRTALHDAFRDAIERCKQAVGYDFSAGLRLVDELVEALGSIAGALQAYGRERDTWSFNLSDVVGELTPLIDAVGERAGRMAFDDTGRESVVELARRLATLTGTDDAWTLVVRTLDADRPDHSYPWLLRYMERAPKTAESLPLLEILARRAGDGVDVDAFVQTAEMFLDVHPRSIGMIVEVLHRAGRIESARFWLGEGRARHEASPLWNRLETQLF